MMGWPRILEAFSASWRMVRSVGPPAGKATTSLMARVGKALPDWASAGAPAIQAPATADTPACRQVLREMLIVFVSLLFI